MRHNFHMTAQSMFRKATIQIPAASKSWKAFFNDKEIVVLWEDLYCKFGDGLLLTYMLRISYT